MGARERDVVREGVAGRGRPSRHTCSDTCLYAQVHTFLDPELHIQRGIQGTAKGEVVADIVCQAATLIPHDPVELDAQATDVGGAGQLASCRG